MDSLRRGPGFHLPVETPVTNLSRSRSCEGRRLVLGNPVRSFSKKCHVYTLKRVGKDDLFVEITESPIVEEADPEGTTRRVDFGAPDVRTVEVDGRTLAPDAAGTYSFNRLRLAGATFQIRYEGQGTLTLDGQRIVARLLPAPPSEKR